MKFFSVDGSFYRFMTSLMNICILSILWLVTSLPLVTVGISTVALFDVCLRMVDDEEGYVTRQYFRAFTRNWKQGFVLGILNLVCIYVVYLDFEIFHKLERHPLPLLIAGMISAFYFLCTFIYAYPQVARYDNKFHIILRNSNRMAIRFFGWTLLILVLCGLEVILFLWSGPTMILGLLIGPGCIVYTISAVMKRNFRKLERDRKEGEHSVS